MKSIRKYLLSGSALHYFKHRGEISMKTYLKVLQIVFVASATLIAVASTSQANAFYGHSRPPTAAYVFNVVGSASWNGASYDAARTMAMRDYPYYERHYQIPQKCQAIYREWNTRSSSSGGGCNPLSFVIGLTGAGQSCDVTYVAQAAVYCVPRALGDTSPTQYYDN
jgi:hypothetical protein